MPKKFIVTEEQLNILKNTLKEDVQYTINPEQVLIVKAFLDSMFEPFNWETVGDDGMPCSIAVVKVKGSDEKKPMLKYKEDVKEMLNARYKNMFVDKEQRRRFLGQVMEDWYNNKIGLYGSLSVNHL